MEEWIFQKFGIDYIHGKADRKTLCTRKCGGLEGRLARRG